MPSPSMAATTETALYRTLDAAGHVIDLPRILTDGQRAKALLKVAHIRASLKPVATHLDELERQLRGLAA